MESANLDDKVLLRQEAIIGSMTRQERRKPALLNASRRKRIAAGAGVTVQEVNKLMKMHKQMSGMMKKMGKKGGMKGLMNAMGGAGGMPPGGMGGLADGMSPQDLAKLGGAPGGLPGLPGGGGLPGLPGGKK
ncbi:MAG: hypothetical protein AAFY85_06155 [Pseudomonadota bacterium]